MIVSRFGQGQSENGEPRLSLAPLVFSGILRLDARGDCRLLMSTAFLSGIDGFDVDKMTVKCGGGTTISQLCRYLHAAGAALPNVPSLPHVTVGGCMSTATHGSGNQFPVISAMAASLELVSADGTLHKFERGTDEFRAAAVGLGLLGIVTSVELDIVHAYDIHQQTYENVPLENISLIEVLGSADSVSALVDFADPTPHAMLTFRDRSVFVSCVSTCISPPRLPFFDALH
eukprot:m.222280 g.222280  ORF g.222280 m.222280 type:complete len:231 (-) comp15622_c1_seq5:658-1350(-)